jgi:hypothetical protein
MVIMSLHREYRHYWLLYQDHQDLPLATYGMQWTGNGPFLVPLKYFWTASLMTFGGQWWCSAWSCVRIFVFLGSMRWCSDWSWVWIFDFLNVSGGVLLNCHGIKSLICGGQWWSIVPVKCKIKMQKWFSFNKITAFVFNSAIYIFYLKWHGQEKNKKMKYFCRRCLVHLHILYSAVLLLLK